MTKETAIKHSARSVMAWLSMLLGVLLSFSVNAEIVTTDIYFDVSQSLVEEGESINMSVDFGGYFDSLNSVRFVFEFEDDLFDESDHFYMWVDVADPTAGSYGGAFGQGYSQDLRVLTLITSLHADAIEDFLDGTQSFDFTMQAGSVNLSRAYLIGDGEFNMRVAVPEPSTGLLLALGLLASLGVGRKRLI